MHNSQGALYVPLPVQGEGVWRVYPVPILWRQGMVRHISQGWWQHGAVVSLWHGSLHRFQIKTQFQFCELWVLDPHAVGGPYDKCVPSVTTEGKGWCATGVNEDGIFSTRDFCSDPNCAPTPPTTTTTTTTTTTVTTTSTTATTTGRSNCLNARF